MKEGAVSKILFPCCYRRAGESYMDCCRRILPVLVELEHCHHNVLVVAHQAILRCVFGYLLRRPIETVPFIKIPQHAIMQVTEEDQV